MDTPQLKVGDKVRIKHSYGIKSKSTPSWCEGWTGTIVRLNNITVTVEFEVNEPGAYTGPAAPCARSFSPTLSAGSPTVPRPVLEERLC